MHVGQGANPSQSVEVIDIRGNWEGEAESCDKADLAVSGWNTTVRLPFLVQRAVLSRSEAVEVSPCSGGDGCRAVDLEEGYAHHDIGLGDFEAISFLAGVEREQSSCRYCCRLCTSCRRRCIFACSPTISSPNRSGPATPAPDNAVVCLRNEAES